MSIASSIPPIPPDEVAIGIMSLAVGVIVMLGIAMPVLVGAIDIPISIDMIACACMEGGEKRVQSYIVGTAQDWEPTGKWKERKE
jgi:hypothetical protein